MRMHGLFIAGLAVRPPSRWWVALGATETRPASRATTYSSGSPHWSGGGNRDDFDDFDDARGKTMKIGVMGTGYLGAVHAVCMAHLGHEVVGFDTKASTGEALASGTPPFYE